MPLGVNRISMEPCIKAGCPADGTVLDPFGGAGTTGMVADRLGRNAILIELNPEYAAMAERRLNNDAGLFADVQLAANEECTDVADSVARASLRHRTQTGEG